MLNIKKTYLTDENKRPVAVQIDIETFEKMEQLLEDSFTSIIHKLQAEFR